MSGSGDAREPLTEEDHAEVVECARYGELEDLVTLLELGANVNFTDAGGSTALHKAAGNGNVDIARVLHKFGARYTSNEAGNTPLHWACLNGHQGMVEFLLLAYPDADVYAKNSFGRSPFTEALAAGHEEIGRMLLAAPSGDPGFQGRAEAGAGSAGGAAAHGAGASVEEEEDQMEGDDEEAEMVANGADDDALVQTSAVTGGEAAADSGDREQ